MTDPEAFAAQDELAEFGVSHADKLATLDAEARAEKIDRGVWMREVQAATGYAERRPPHDVYRWMESLYLRGIAPLEAIQILCGNAGVGE